MAWQPFHQNKKKTPIRIDRDGTRTQRILNTIRYGGDGEDKLGYLEEGGSVGDIVADEALRGDADLVLLDGRLVPRSLHSLVPVHLSRGLRRSSPGGLRG